MQNTQTPESSGTVKPPSARALVVSPFLNKRAFSRQAEMAMRGALQRTPEARLEEAIGLAQAIDLDIRVSQVIPLSEIKPSTFMGSGKVADLGALVKEHEAELVVVDTALSPVQQRNLEREWKCKVLDRTGLILEIFGRRARTREGTLQVELAHLNWQKSRLVRSWTHLERQRGGFGFLGGPGETQIEADRRVIGERITKIERELEQVKRTRGLHRSARKRIPYPIVALVGYTNAGKSTLFNRMTQATVLAEDMLFATLDPTLRAVRLPHGVNIILSDTVGFISELPTTLVAAFRATLEEVLEADIILHIRDISHPDTEAQAADVESILQQLGIDAGSDHSRVIEVWNKVDALSDEYRDSLIETVRRRQKAPLLVSALTGQGMEDLHNAIEANLSTKHTELDITLDAEDGAGLAWLYRHTEVLEKEVNEEGQIRVRVRVALEREEGVRVRFNASEESYLPK